MLLAEGTFVDGARRRRHRARDPLDEGGRVLTLSDFETDARPDLFLCLAAGDPRPGGEVDECVSLGRLQGNKGDQQYAIPRDADLERYDTVVVWCRTVHRELRAGGAERRLSAAT